MCVCTHTYIYGLYVPHEYGYCCYRLTSNLLIYFFPQAFIRLLLASSALDLHFLVGQAVKLS